MRQEAEADQLVKVDATCPRCSKTVRKVLVMVEIAHRRQPRYCYDCEKLIKSGNVEAPIACPQDKIVCRRRLRGRPPCCNDRQANA